MYKFDQKGLSYVKVCRPAWKELDLCTNDAEYLVAVRLSNIIQPFSCMLSPLNNKTSVSELSRVLRKSRRTIKAILEKLEALGVYAEINGEWVFNPFLAHKGEKVDPEVIRLFIGGRFG